MPSQDLKIPVLRYLAYSSLVMAKRVLGMNPYRQRNYLIWKLLKLLDSGQIDRSTLSITSRGKIDGVGAQALAKVSAMALAKAHGLTYVHTPFEVLAHAESEPEAWVEKWEHLLNMGHGHPALDPGSMKIVSLGDYISNPDLWAQKVVLSDRHFHPFCDLAPQWSGEVAKELKPAFCEQNQAPSAESEFVIGVHVRRGDVSAKDPETKHRFTDSSHTITVLEQVVRAAKEAGHNPLIQLHSNASKEELAEFSEFPGIQYYAGTSAVETFIALARSNILITAQSDFSVLAGYYCKGIVVCDPRRRAPLPQWIKSTEPEQTFARELKRRLEMPNKRQAQIAD